MFSASFKEWFTKMIDTYGEIVVFLPLDYNFAKKVHTLDSILEYLNEYGSENLKICNAFPYMTWNKIFTLSEVIEIVESYDFSNWEKQLKDYWAWYDEALEYDNLGYKLEKATKAYLKILEIETKYKGGKATMADYVLLLFLANPSYIIESRLSPCYR